jgi:hypothetical protein
MNTKTTERTDPVPQYLDLEECGCCGQYHRPEFSGDCRDDGERFPTWQVYRGLWGGRSAYLIDDSPEPELFRYV